MSASSELFHQNEGVCFYCLQRKRRGNYTRDHFIPRSCGGDGVENDVGACTQCNRAKGNFDPRAMGLTSPVAMSVAEREALRKLRRLVRYAASRHTHVAQLIDQGRLVEALRGR